MQQDRNMKETGTVLRDEVWNMRDESVTNGSGWVSQLLGGRKVQVDGHFKSKVEHQVEWLMHFKPQLGDGFVRQVAAAAFLL